LLRHLQATECKEAHACITRRENATLKSDLYHAWKPFKTAT
jgi:hypothetical protein